MPDTSDYPVFAAWDLAFHCVALAHVDPAFARYQLTLLWREWFQHPGGALPAYEWDFGDVNPPVHAWAALEVFVLDGAHDLDFLSRVFDKLLVNFTWWVNREDAGGSYLFEGGFMGLDNIGPIDRSHLPVAGCLEQSDSTGWMAGYAAVMATVAAILHRSGHRPAVDLVQTFLEHFAAIRDALDGIGLWDAVDGMFYDRLCTADGTVSIRVRSIASMIPMLAGGVVNGERLDGTLSVSKRFGRFLHRHGLYEPARLAEAGLLRFFGDDRQIEYPTGSGQRTTLDRVADDLRARLVGLFLAGPDGRRPVFGEAEKMQTDPRSRDQILFYEYFNGDDGAGLGASHQTGWTGLVADLIRRRHKAVPPTFEVVQRLLTAPAPPPPVPRGGQRQ